MRPYKDTLRDRIVVRMCNFLMRFASKNYREIVTASIEYGLDSAARDAREGLPLPPSWRELS